MLLPTVDPAHLTKSQSIYHWKRQSVTEDTPTHRRKPTFIYTDWTEIKVSLQN